LGPSWRTVGDEPATSNASLWKSDETADVFEWSLRSPSRRITRTAVLLHGRRLALVADQVAADVATASFAMRIPDSVAIAPNPKNRGAILTSRDRRASARVYPVGLPCLEGGDGEGQLHVEDQGIVLRQMNPGGRCWMPLLVSWDSLRERRKVVWNRLTITEQSEICPPSVAVATRVSWGPDESLVVYRSLARPALRVFLGHSTRARFLIGLFNRDGTVEPLVAIDG
jgi:hypothetical protein